ncbi:MAG: fatty acid desaturase [Acidobacteriota bacterium]|nr:fatty acid desaturase [Acidobacteriota bacterium]
MQTVEQGFDHWPAGGSPTGESSWQRIVAKYHVSNHWLSSLQLLTGPVAYVLTCYVAYLISRVSIWLALAVMVLAAGFYVRSFIVFHDCAHGSFFRSSRANTIVGFITGVLAFTPFQHWRREHSIHHATAGDLDRRGVGDVWTLTVGEYQQASRWVRLSYRLVRNPFLMLLVGPAYQFLVKHRFSSRHDGRRERRSVLWTNLTLAGIVTLASLTVGIKAYLLIQLPVFLIGGAAGIWLFYVQHEFEDTWWERNDEWDYVRQALDGSSFYKLPLVLQWFTGNIGFHHVHHLSPRIPNYHLPRCHRENSMLQQVKPLTLWASLKCARLHLWDEEQCKLVPFRTLRSSTLPPRSGPGRG